MKYEREKVIERPRDAVAELYADRPRINDWHPSVADYTHSSGDPGQPGAKAEIVLKQGITIVETVTGRGDPPGSFSHTDKPKDWNCHVTFENTFEELSPNSTAWTLLVEVSAGSMTMEIKVKALEMSGTIRKEICKYMEAFKEFAEGEL